MEQLGTVVSLRGGCVGIGLALLALGCGQDQQGDELATMSVAGTDVLLDFEWTPCSHGGAGPRIPVPPATEPCLNWQLGPNGNLRLEFRAVPAGCLDEELLAEIPWEPSAAVPGPDHLELAVVWPFPDPTGCGECEYDFTFEVDVPEWQDALEVELETRSCLSCSAGTQRFSLSGPATEDPQGTCGPE